jgi:uncharacterized paraquat-inducible protein A
MPNEHYNQAVADPSLIACPHCDLLQHLPNLASAASARCPRCNEELWRVLFTAIVAPALQIVLMLAIVLGARRQPAPRWTGTLLRHHGTTQTWSMIEVMMLGVLVALVKIADYATVIPGTALFVLGALIVLLAAMQASFEPRQVWEKIQWAEVGATDDAVDAAS